MCNWLELMSMATSGSDASPSFIASHSSNIRPKRLEVLSLQPNNNVTNHSVSVCWNVYVCVCKYVRECVCK